MREVCFVLQVRLSQTGLKSFGSISEPKIKGKTLKLALLKTAHHMSHINQIHQKRKFCLLSKATFIHWICPKKLLCKWLSQSQLILRHYGTPIIQGPICQNCVDGRIQTYRHTRHWLLKLSQVRPKHIRLTFSFPFPFILPMIHDLPINNKLKFAGEL